MSVTGQPLPPIPQVGEHVGRYLLLRGDTSGSDGHVFVAYDPKLDRDVVLKLLRAKARAKTDERERLLAEAQSLAKLSHPNVVIVYDASTWADGVYMTSEYVEGATLDVWLAAQPRSFEAIRKVLLEAARGLGAAHEAGIVHLDVRPENVLVGDDGVARVRGFSLARHVSGLRSLESQSGGGSGGDHRAEFSVVGRPGYVAPECYAGGIPSALSDQFSFCVTAWVALLGALPFRAHTRAELEAAVRAGEWTVPSTGHQCPGFVIPVLERGLQPRPAARYPSMQALLAALVVDPRRRRRNLWTAVGGGIIAAALFGAHRFHSGRRLELCERGEALVGQVWGPARRSDLQDSISRVEAPFAEFASRSVVERLDDYAARWAAEHRGACLATRARAEQSEELLQLRIRCLEERTGRLSALLEQLEELDDATVERSLDAVASLPPIADCSDTASVLATAEVDSTSPELKGLQAKAAGLVALRREPEALAALDRLEREAKRAQDFTSVAEARLGRALLRGGPDSKAAVTALEGAAVAADHAGADRIRLHAYTEMIRLLAQDPQTAARGVLLSSIADGIVERANGSANEAARLRLSQAASRLALGEHAAAIAHCERAVERLDDNPSQLELIAVYDTLARAQLGVGDRPAALESWERSHLIAQLNYGPHHPVTARALFELGTNRRSSGLKDEGRRDQAEALSVLRAVRGPEDPEVRRWRDELSAP